MIIWDWKKGFTMLFLGLPIEESGGLQPIGLHTEVT